MKSANQLYRESGSQLSFKDWLNQEYVPTKNNDSKQDEFVGNVKVMNVPLKYIIIGAVVIVGGIIVYNIVKKKQ